VRGSWAQLNTDEGGAFGANFQHVEQLTQLDTTSELFATFLTLTTPSIPAGTYRFGVAFQYSASTGATRGQYRFRLDASTDLDAEDLDVASAFERKTYSSFGLAVLTAGIHTFDMDIRRLSGPGTFTIDDGHIELWRAS
jgi:hypothetical protein